MNKNRVLDLRVYQKKKRSGFNFKKFLLFAILVIVILGAIFVGIFYRDKIVSLFQKDKWQVNKNDQKEAQILVEKVSKLMELPINEIPTVATILDKEKMKDYPFFDSCENGDKMLVYRQAMKVILYRPSTDKIIGIAPLYVENNK